MTQDTKTQTQREKNQEFSARLLRLAEVYGTAGDANVPQPFLCIYSYSKEELLERIRMFGGSWDKVLTSYTENMHLVSRSLPLTLSIPRDKVCRKTVTWDCEPMFGPGEEQELDAALLQDHEPAQDEPSPDAQLEAELSPVPMPFESFL